MTRRDRSLLVLVCAALPAIFFSVACDPGPRTLGGPVAIVKGKPPNHGVLGIQFVHDPDRSLEIAEVIPDTPAHIAGLAAGDIITSIDDHKLSDFAELSDHLKKSRPGEIAHLVVRHEGQPRKLDLRLMSMTEFITLYSRIHDPKRTP